ncbi:putative Zn(II)2Cys6 transcription factor [Aspergillus campestris IBT 28561]|uniref:Zn(II)2Cys6 transcription factor n=1 Tax=Aspergillus campestris (strain IBT 28561) TaxID=1392248 RepID=A0A2I1CX19_ASPC2|nr:putative Zn(II)2Cys6 transcription factor [Aspergillus campestris IBT 28561]PKY02163.1 putative Zn(II)2Cys6 transcription factor [Aspergillus campestris IBT 28561]
MDMDSDQINQKIRSRRTHRKSRLGCGNCKKRRVKCDEKQPVCNNCLVHSINCDFQNSSSRSPSAGSTPPQRYQFRQSKYQTLASSPSQEEGNYRSVAAFAWKPGEGISLADLHLFHHFTTATAGTITDETKDPQKVWQIHVPRWGMSFPSIQHLLLTLSALHLAYLNPARRGEYTRQADDHFTFGVRSVATVLALDTLDSQNCQLIYIAAVMVCFAYFARGPQDGEYLVFNTNGKSEWLVLLHGVRSILAQRHGEIFTGVLKPREESPGLDDIDVCAPELDEELSCHIQRLHEVGEMVILEVEGDREVYVDVVDNLVECFEEAYRRRRTGCHPTDLMPYTMGWTFRFPDTMITKLEEREPIALVILAHWAILLRYMRDTWFMERWDHHIVSGIKACLPETYHAWIEWPEEVVAYVPW